MGRFIICTFFTKQYWDDVVIETDVAKVCNIIAGVRTAYKILVRKHVWKRMVQRLSTNVKLRLKWLDNKNGTCDIWWSEIAVLSVVCHTGTLLEKFYVCDTAHSGDEGFVCLVCGKAFTQQISLKRYVRLQTGEKPLHSHCGESFALKHDLKRHTAGLHEVKE